MEIKILTVDELNLYDIIYDLFVDTVTTKFNKEEVFELIMAEGKEWLEKFSDSFYHLNENETDLEEAECSYWDMLFELEPEDLFEDENETELSEEEAKEILDDFDKILDSI